MALGEAPPYIYAHMCSSQKAAANEDAKVTEAEASVADAPESGAPEEKKRKPKKKKFAMLLTYSGKGFAGMQINPDVSTIEGELFRALRLDGLISEADAKKPNNSFYYQRAARTDKGVSAVRQVCSMLLPLADVEAKELPGRLNAHLPAQIRVMEVKRSTKGFDAQKSCDSRTYSYTLPSYAFAHLDELTNEDFRLSSERRAEVNGLLGLYVGTHNFYNYTSRREHGDASCKRYILSFVCGEPFLITRGDKSMELVTCVVHGQSFMLHQIRKMMGMMIAIVRGFKGSGDMERSWEPNRLDVPMAPGLGLLLEKPHYERYDERYGQDHLHLNEWEEEAAVEEFKQTVILPDIFDTEIEQRSMLSWLESLVVHDFKDGDQKQSPEDVKEEESNSVKEEPEAKRTKMSLGEFTLQTKREKEDAEKEASEARVIKEDAGDAENKGDKC